MNVNSTRRAGTVGRVAAATTTAGLDLDVAFGAVVIRAVVRRPRPAPACR